MFLLGRHQKVQSKTEMGYHSLTTRLTKVRGSDNTCCQQGDGEEATSYLGMGMGMGISSFSLESNMAPSAETDTYPAAQKY